MNDVPWEQTVQELQEAELDTLENTARVWVLTVCCRVAQQGAVSDAVFPQLFTMTRKQDECAYSRKL